MWGSLNYPFEHQFMILFNLEVYKKFISYFVNGIFQSAHIGSNL